uniref:Rad21_Rec8 domain-containing protein n=1 Tax=Mesocestoides corti TaxID=53468 RepID=A0A5K3EIA1_MESCO
MNINQSRPEDITMREDFGDVNLGRLDDDFGEGAFEELPSREVLRGGDGGYDSVYGRATDGSGRYSVRESDRPSIRVDIDADDTLIGSKDKSGKVTTGLTPAADIGLDDDDFVEPLYGGDSDGSFGGDIEPSIFTNPTLFGDAATTNQLENLAEGLTLPGETATMGADGGVKEGPTTVANIASEVLDSNGTTPQIHNQPPLRGHSTVNVTGNINARDNTTLISNESEAFALLPIDVQTTAEPRRAAKRRRRLIIDELKSIPSELMKTQMQDTSEIVTQLDLAPPTKRLMHMKETGGLDKLFALPGRAIPSRILQRVFSRNLHSQPIPEAYESVTSMITSEENRPHLIFRQSASTVGTSAIEEQLLSAAATPRDSLCTPSGFQVGQTGAQHHEGALGLVAIPEESISGGHESCFPGYPPSTADHQSHHHGDKVPGTLQNEHHHSQIVGRLELDFSNWACLNMPSLSIPSTT